MQKLQDHTLAHPLSMVGIRPKPFVNQHNYHVMKQSKVHGTYDHNRYNGPYSTIEQQIRAAAMLSTQIYDVEQKQFEEQIKQVENIRSHEYHLNQMRDQIIPNHSNCMTRQRRHISTF